MSSDYETIFPLLASSDISLLEEFAPLVDGFPHGLDDLLHLHWITHAIDSGSLEAVAWMLDKGVALDFRDDTGYTPLHSALERPAPLRYQLLNLLLRYGAPVNAHGINDWTPAHMAAAYEDAVALKILVQAGADLTIRTRIDNYATPLEEARILGRKISLDQTDC